MKRKQYFIATKDGKIAVTGYPVVILGYEEFEFFVHRPYAFGKLWNAGWNISEAITGLHILPLSYPGGMSNSTRAGALAIVAERFKSMGHEYALPILKRAIKAAQDESARESTCKAIDEVMA